MSASLLAQAHTAWRVTGSGPLKVLLLHALTGGPDAADREGVKGWWAPIFKEGAPFSEDRATVWTPNLLGGCYGSSGPSDIQPWPEFTTRDQAQVLAEWILREGLTFDVLVGGSLGGMVALELAILLPDHFKRVGVIGCGGDGDAWMWGTNEIQRAILLNPSLPDREAVALARHAAMFTFRAPGGINDRFRDRESIRGWLRYHGQALADRFTRGTFLAMLNAMDGHDIGRGRGGLVEALKGFKAELFVLGIDSDFLFVPGMVQRLMDAAQEAGCLRDARWIHSPHGHDAFLIEWDQVGPWLQDVAGIPA